MTLWEDLADISMSMFWCSREKFGIKSILEFLVLLLLIYAAKQILYFKQLGPEFLLKRELSLAMNTSWLGFEIVNTILTKSMI